MYRVRVASEVMGSAWGGVGGLGAEKRKKSTILLANRVHLDPGRLDRKKWGEKFFS
jgi:hypothetical protein